MSLESQKHDIVSFIHGNVGCHQQIKDLNLGNKFKKQWRKLKGKKWVQGHISMINDKSHHHKY